MCVKKHWKKVLAVFVAILVIVGGYLIYILQFKEYDVADKEVTEITKETYTLGLRDGTVIELDEEGNIVGYIASRKMPDRHQIELVTEQYKEMIASENE